MVDPQPIVALYSLKDHHDWRGNPEVGLRLVHGALASMGVIVDSQVCWDYELFRAQVFGNGEKRDGYDKAAAAVITVEGAVEMLWKLFGRDRPFLLLHDKTSTIEDIKKAQGVLDSLHELVVKHESLDVVVSARSHQYMGARPPSTPQQHIQYVQLQPLLRSKQVEGLAREWAEYVRGRYEASIGSRMDGRVFRLLTGAHLLAGHYAGSEEQMTQWFRECIDEQREVFAWNEPHSVKDLLQALIRDDSEFIYLTRFNFEDGVDAQALHEYLDTQAFTQRGKSTLSSGLYWSSLHKPQDSIVAVTIHTPWYTAIYPTQVLQLQAALLCQTMYQFNRPHVISSQHQHLRDFQAIFARKGAVAMDLDGVLEPCVVMSALTTLRETRDCDLSAAFGCAFPVTKTIATLDKGICVTDADSLPLRSVLQQEPDVVLLPSGPQKGYSALFRLHEGADNKPLYAYLQVPTASARTNQQDLSEVLVTAVKNILRAHSQLPAAGANFTLSSGGVNPNKALLEQLYVIFYDARNPMESVALDYAALQNVAQEQLTRAAEQGLEAQSPAAEEEAYLPVVLEFLQHHQGNLQVVTQPQLRDFLIPSFVPLMELTNHVYGPEDQQLPAGAV